MRMGRLLNYKSWFYDDKSLHEVYKTLRIRKAENSNIHPCLTRTSRRHHVNYTPCARKRGEPIEAN